MSNCTVIEHEVPIVITSDDCNAEPIVINAVESTTVLVESEPEIVEINAGPRGLPGLDVELQKSATHVQWRLHKDGEEWQNLIAIADLVGPPSMADAPTDGTPYARKDGAWAAAATAAQGAAADAALPKAGGTMTGAITFAGGQTWPTFNQSTTGNAATATKLATARTIGGVSFDGSANINLPGVNTAGTQNTTGSAARWTTARTLTLGATGKSVDGSADVSWTLAEMGAAADSAVVKLTGAQSVAGVKTFSDRSVHAGAYTPSLTPAHSATPTFDCAAGNVFEPGVVTSNITSMTMSNPVAGQTVNVILKQDATGGRTIAVPSGAKIDGSPNTGANRISILVMQYYGAGSIWIGNWLVIPS